MTAHKRRHTTQPFALCKLSYCVICGKQELDKDTIGINKKLLGTDIENFYCMECLAEYLECTVDELLDKIEEFKAEGCKLFL